MATKTKKAKKVDDKIKELKDKIVSNSKDSEWGKKMLSQLTSLQKQADVEAVELIVPTKEVKDKIDFGSCMILRTIRGYLFVAKGGLSTFVDLRMVSICAMLNTIFELHTKADKTEEEQQLYDSFVSAVQYVFQTPIFASLNDVSLFSVASNILSVFNEYCTENIDKATLHEETEEDIKANIAHDNIAKVLDEAIQDMKQ